MKLRIIKGLSLLIPVIGVIGIFIFAFAGKIYYGWIMFIGLMILSGIINFLFFRCPHCGKAIPANSSLNQKYCPLCGEDLGMKPSVFSYYGTCSRSKDGTYKAKSMVGPMVFIVSTIIIAMIVVGILGFDSILIGIGRILIIISVILGLMLGFFCRCVVGSAAKLSETRLYFSKLPFKWKSYDLDVLKALAEEQKPFYHVVKGYVIATPDGALAIPVATYKGGQEFLVQLTQKLNQPMVDIVPDSVISKHSTEAKQADEKWKVFVDNSIKEREQ